MRCLDERETHTQAYFQNISDTDVGLFDPMLDSLIRGQPAMAESKTSATNCYSWRVSSSPLKGSITANCECACARWPDAYLHTRDTTGLGARLVRSSLKVSTVGGCAQTTMEFRLDALSVGVPFGVHAVHLRDDLRDELWFRVGAPNPHRDVVPISVVQRLQIGR